jgi:chemotaxis protein CheY-P-specific phosphatase CheC
MQLTPSIHAALREVFGFAVDRAAASLRKLLDAPVSLTAPAIYVVSPPEVQPTLSAIPLVGEGLIIFQDLLGAPSGRVGLFMSREHARALVTRVWGQMDDVEALPTSAQEVLAEIGNVLLGAAVSGLADILEMRIPLSVPIVVAQGVDSDYAGWLTRDMPPTAGAVVIMTTQLVMTTLLPGGLIVLSMATADIDPLLALLGQQRRRIS